MSFESQYFISLSNKVQELLEVIDRLKNQNNKLSESLETYKNGVEVNYEKRILDLEEEIRKFKKENKTLKEKEKLIKNKVERLSVKLNQVEI